MQTDPVGYADQMNLYAYVHNDPMNFIDPTGELRVSAATAKAYPKAAAYLKSRKIRSKKKYRAFDRYANASKTEVDNAFTNGKGPDVIHGDLIGANGSHSTNGPSSEITISSDVMEAFESGEEGSQALLDSTIEHEVVHDLERMSPTPVPGEEGTRYEQEVYGEDIDNLEEAREYERNN